VFKTSRSRERKAREWTEMYWRRRWAIRNTWNRVSKKTNELSVVHQRSGVHFPDAPLLTSMTEPCGGRQHDKRRCIRRGNGTRDAARAQRGAPAAERCWIPEYWTPLGLCRQCTTEKKWGGFTCWSSNVKFFYRVSPKTWQTCVIPPSVHQNTLLTRTYWL